ncbi:fimbrial protein FimV [Frateuria sp. Soil773]|uniref:FimV/HubP family polar landmark protein n=1 Tax=Frateuria sp. Soil773 TaxID=1736407 RepID=UPI0006FCE65D|nr:FimV/HubP family polar landmark protein [Frateuria sp. Soil773]KRE94986.1 fimbrial protein FimV [Frateuria sp. Soil773]
MNRSLKLSALLALALGSSQAVALELGQIQVKSALGQPLLAEIPLTPESPAELRNLSARLASAEDFARAGISAGRPGIPLQFSVAGTGEHRVIRITSTAAVNDPYLDLLVEVSSAAGKSVREYAILLDPPGAAQATAGAPAAAPARSAPSRPARAAAAAPQRQPAPASRAVVTSDGKYGPVERGQTLSGIARLTAPAGTDVNQMMLALKQANPDAFYRDNINALKSGAVLRVPTSQEAQAMAVAAAVAEVRRQNGDWRSGAASAPTTVADAATRAGTSSAPSGAADVADRLTLVPAAEGGKSAGARGGKGEASAALRQDLARSQEMLTALQQQGSELKSRLKDLEDINGKNERLLSLKDNEIADLQRKLAEARKVANLPAEPAAASTAHAAAGAAAVEVSALKETAAAPSSAATTGPATADTAATAAATGAVAASAASTATPPPAAVQPAPAKAKPAPAARSHPATPAASLEEPWYMQTWAWAAGLGAIVLLLLFAVLGRRRKPAKPAVPSGSSLADRFGGVAPLPEGSADPDQDELLDQLAEHPDDVGLHLELVSLYYGRRDVEHFEAAAEAMHAHVTDPQQPEWQDVVGMGRDLAPGHPLFLDGSHAEHAETAEDERDALNAFDLDHYAASSDETVLQAPAMPPLPPRQKVSEYHFDFNLTPPVQAGPATPAATEDEPSPEAGIEPMAPAAHADPVAEAESEPLGGWRFDEPEADAGIHELGQFSDDPIDTKLDLARAYLDMGDSEGARAMLEEVLGEGSQMQKDTARQLLENLS